MKKISLPIILAIAILLLAAFAFQLEGVSNFSGIHLSQSTFGTATPQLMVNNGGTNRAFEVQDSGTAIMYINDGGAAAFAAPTAIATAAPALVVDSAGVSNLLEVRDAATPQFTINNGGASTFASDMTVAGVSAWDDTDSVLTGAQTITPTYSYLQVSPTAVLTITLATGAAADGDLLIIHNLVATTTTIVDTGATVGGGAITLGQDDLGIFIFGDGVWVEIASPDNS